MDLGFRIWYGKEAAGAIDTRFRQEHAQLPFAFPGKKTIAATTSIVRYGLRYNPLRFAAVMRLKTGGNLPGADDAGRVAATG